jgi:hypothetical protein
MTTRIATNYFEAKAAERTLYGGTFSAPAVPKGHPPFILTIPDHIQREQRPHIIGGGRTPETIFGEHIAADIRREWAEEGMGMNTACGPGIWVVRDVIPLLNPDGTMLLDVDKKAQYRPATEDEKEQMWAEDLAEQSARQEAWALYLKEQGDILDADPEKKRGRLISPTMRAAVAYYGYSVPWLDSRKAKAAGDVKVCQWCAKENPAAVIKCQHCHEVVDAARYTLQKEIERLAGKSALKNQQEQPAA